MEQGHVPAKLPSRSLSLQVSVMLLPQGQLFLCTLLLGEGSPSSTPAFKENKTPVGAGGAESHSKEGVGLPASHDSVEEWAWGLLCP